MQRLPRWLGYRPWSILVENNVKKSRYRLLNKWSLLLNNRYSSKVLSAFLPISLQGWRVMQSSFFWWKPPSAMLVRDDVGCAPSCKKRRVALLTCWLALFGVCFFRGGIRSYLVGFYAFSIGVGYTAPDDMFSTTLKCISINSFWGRMAAMVSLSGASNTHVPEVRWACCPVRLVLHPSYLNL